MAMSNSGSREHVDREKDRQPKLLLRARKQNPKDARQTVAAVAVGY